MRQGEEQIERAAKLEMFMLGKWRFYKWLTADEAKKYAIGICQKQPNVWRVTWLA